MAEINATILIPDISGFTEFITTTELNHSSRAINMLINAIVDSVDEKYEVTEIEGDAVLLIKRESAPSKNDRHNFSAGSYEGHATAWLNVGRSIYSTDKRQGYFCVW